MGKQVMNEKEKKEILEKLPQTRFYAGIAKNFDVAVCFTKGDVKEILKKYCGSVLKERSIAWFTIHIDLNLPEMFWECRDKEECEPEFKVTSDYLNRLYIEVYYFLTGRFKLKPKMKKTK